MKKSTSIYLDLLRVIAAFGVLLSHANFTWFSDNLFPRNSGHNFVLIFFVLSGYLISYTVNKKNKSQKEYLIDRFSRLYSVVLPALFFTYLIDFAGSHLNAKFYINKVADNHQLLRFILNATFLQQIWGLCSAPSSNVPFWSIAYEFWYYILFWIYLYFKRAWKFIGFVAVCLIIGIKIILLLPVWAFGVIAFNCNDKLPLKNTLAIILFFLTTIILIGLSFFWDFSFYSAKYPFGHSPLFFSSNFIFDWIYGAIIAINLFCFNSISFCVKLPLFIENGIKYLSSLTFSLYLYHLPILIFIAALIPFNKSSYFEVISILIIVIVMVSFLSKITEKQRNHWKVFFSSLSNFF